MGNKNYDVAIIGGGIGGLMAAYRLKQNSPELKIVITERGNTLEKDFVPQEEIKPVFTVKPAVLQAVMRERVLFLTVNSIWVLPTVAL